MKCLSKCRVNEACFSLTRSVMVALVVTCCPLLVSRPAHAQDEDYQDGVLDTIEPSNMPLVYENGTYTLTKTSLTNDLSSQQSPSQFTWNFEWYPYPYVMAWEEALNIAVPTNIFGTVGNVNYVQASASAADVSDETSTANGGSFNDDATLTDSFIFYANVSQAFNTFVNLGASLDWVGPTSPPSGQESVTFGGGATASASSSSSSVGRVTNI